MFTKNGIEWGRITDPHVPTGPMTVTVQGQFNYAPPPGQVERFSIARARAFTL